MEYDVRFIILFLPILIHSFLFFFVSMLLLVIILYRFSDLSSDFFCLSTLKLLIYYGYFPEFCLILKRGLFSICNLGNRTRKNNSFQTLSILRTAHRPSPRPHFPEDPFNSLGGP